MPSMKLLRLWFAVRLIATLLLALLGLRWFVHGLDHRSFFDTMTGVLALSTAVLVFFVRPADRAQDDVTSHVVGGLADVLAQLGRELNDAHTRERDQDAIKWGTAQLEISVLMQSTDTSGVDFKVVSGERKDDKARTSKLTLHLYPVNDDSASMGA
jgi:hypothetical protein